MSVRIVSLFLLLATPIVSCAAEPIASPNIVLFLADDLGWGDVPWHGSPYKMPHLEQLANNGVRLESHYVHPMCSPTRAALMTGRYASRFGVTAAQNGLALPWNTRTLAAELQSAGYDTAITGKWHLGSKPDQGPQRFGFVYGYGSLAGGCGPFNHRYKEGPFTHTWHRNGELIEEEGHVTDLIAREAVQWIQQRGSKPFFLYVPFTAIHVPIQEPETWHAMNPHLVDPAQRLRAACASHMDHAIGQVLAALDQQKLRNNTLVLFLSDNGAHGPSDNQGGPYPGEYGHLKVGNANKPWRGHKTQVYEGGIRTPGLVHWPARLQRGEVHHPLHVVDWMPTLCTLVGAKVPEDLMWDGIDIWPVITQQKKETPPRTLYSAAPGFRAQMVRHGDWKLVVTKAARAKSQNPPTNNAEESEELFNLKSDPAESRNLAMEKPDILAELKRELADVSSRDRDAIAKE